MERADELKERIRQQPLNDRLEESRRRIGDMCSKGRCPKMTIPVHHDDDDFYINTTLADAQATIAALQARVMTWEERHNIDVEQLGLQIEKQKSQLTQRTAELEALRKWRDYVTVALQRPGGAFFEDVPKHIVDLVAKLERVRGELAKMRERKAGAP